MINEIIEMAIGGNKLSNTNTVPNKQVIGSTVVSDTNPVPSKQILGAAVVSDSNPVPTKQILGAAVVSDANPIPVKLTTVDTNYPGTPNIYNVTCTLADTEYSQVLPADTKKLTVNISGGAADKNFRIAFVTGKVATPTAPYIQKVATGTYEISGVNMATGTLYIASSEAAKVAEITAWT